MHIHITCMLHPTKAYRFQSPSKTDKKPPSTTKHKSKDLSKYMMANLALSTNV